MKIVDLSEMKKIEQKAEKEFGFSEEMIIENVGLRGADFIFDKVISNSFFGEIVFLIGKGNNGADGLAVARYLKNRGLSIRAFLLFPEESLGLQLKKQLHLARCYGVKISEFKNLEQISSYFTQTQDKYLVIDAILGTGFRLPLSNFLFDVISTANTYSNLTIALDIPSGVEGESGKISSCAIRADFTLAIGLPKLGYFVGGGSEYCGKIKVIDVGLPKMFLEEGDLVLLTKKKVADTVGKRSHFSHKNTFGHALVLGGSQGLCGALALASESAMRAGTGLVSAATWEINYHEFLARLKSSEVMTGIIPIEGEEKDIKNVLRNLAQYESIVIGPGLGQSEKAREITLEVLNSYPGPVVVDADSIKVLSAKKDSEVFYRRKGPTVLTPHIGEFANFIGEKKNDVLERPIFYLKKFVDKLNCCVVLKGHATYLGFPNGKIAVNYSPNAGMATAGTGDVLAGILGGLLAQLKPQNVQSGLFLDKNKIYEALSMGVMLHTLSGKAVLKERGPRSMTASCLLEHISTAFLELGDEIENRREDWVI